MFIAYNLPHKRGWAQRRMKIGNGDKNRGKPNSDREKRVERLFLYELFVEAAIMNQKVLVRRGGDEKS